MAGRRFVWNGEEPSGPAELVCKHHPHQFDLRIFQKCVKLYGFDTMRGRKHYVIFHCCCLQLLTQIWRCDENRGMQRWLRVTFQYFLVNISYEFKHSTISKKTCCALPATHALSRGQSDEAN